MDNKPFRSILVIFSGLPGTGKSTLASRLARELRWPLLRIDDVALYDSPGAGIDFWDEKILALLTLAEAQLEIGLSVIIDSVFMAYDRHHAQELASRYDAAFRPVYTFVSNEALWQERVTARFDALKNEAVATWSRIQHQRQSFLPWQPGTALFVDSARSVEENFASVQEYVTRQDVSLASLKIDFPLVSGKYHQQS